MSDNAPVASRDAAERISLLKKQFDELLREQAELRHEQAELRREQAELLRVQAKLLTEASELVARKSLMQGEAPLHLFLVEREAMRSSLGTCGLQAMGPSGR